MNTRRIPLLLAAVVLAPAALQAQAFRVQAELESWRARHGESWQVTYDAQTGWGRFLYGGAAPSAFTPHTDAEYLTLARNALASSKAIHGLEADSLVPDRVVFLPLGNAGTTDKVTVNFHQEVDGVRVLGAYASVLFDTSGRVLSVDSTGLPGLGRGFSTSPAIEAAVAVDTALGLFVADAGLPPTAVDEPELVIEQQLVDKLRQPRLAWQVGVHHRSTDGEPAGYSYRIDALDGSLLSRRDAVHYFDVSGTVRSMASPGAYPDQSSNPEQQIVMPHLSVNSAQGNALTDSNGNFTIVGASAPLSVTVSYDGTFCQTNDQAQSDYSLTTTLSSASGNTILMNPTSAALTTAEANAFNWIGKLRDWTRSVNPSDVMADFLATSNVNISSTCNAYYDGVSVNFFRSGGGCVNTAYSSVVVHEMGHWLNDFYASNNGSDGFGEGNADVFAMYILDDPIVGHDFCGTGCDIRDGNNTRLFCGDCCGGCYGEVHADGEVLMGAMWKVRSRLKTTLGAAQGRVASNTLFNAWMNAYNDSQIKTIIETHWLVLDDDDGDLGNGTPHFADIDGGFTDQGFPGYQDPFIGFANVTIMGTTPDETGPYVIEAEITAYHNPPTVNQYLHYRVDGASSVDVPMTPVGGNTWRGLIPGQPSPARIEYYVSAVDSAGKGGTFPEGGASDPLWFHVGVVHPWFTTDFESGTAGWTHGSPNGTEDDWQLSSQVGVAGSYGKWGDPTTAPSGSNIWGNDLGALGWNGDYSNNVSNWLRSPVIDLSGAFGTILTFKRWLRVESGQYDQATITVNGLQVYSNPYWEDLLDDEWVDVEIDISAIADDNPSVQIEFGLVTDLGLTFGGWNIDDVRIITIDPPCPTPTNYCTSKMTSVGTLPVAGYTGTPYQSAGDFVLTLSQALPNKNAIPIWGPNQGSLPGLGGLICIGPPLTRGPLAFTSATGTASFPVDITPAMVGTTRNFQWWFRDPVDPDHAGLSNGLSVTFCN